MAMQTNQLTAGDVCRALGVDLKTVHNWVSRGYLPAQRTKGGHLRIPRTAVLRLLRRRGNHVPEACVVRNPRTMVLGLGPALAAELNADHYDCLYAGALELASGEFDLAVVCLSDLDPRLARSFIDALRRCPMTAGTLVLGWGADDRTAAAFHAGGADRVVETEAGVARAADWLLGLPEELPTPLESWWPPAEELPLQQAAG